MQQTPSEENERTANKNYLLGPIGQWTGMDAEQTNERNEHVFYFIQCSLNKNGRPLKQPIKDWRHRKKGRKLKCF